MVINLSPLQEQFWQAIRDDDPVAVRDTLALGADPRLAEPQPMGTLPIHWAAYHASPLCLNLLFRQGLGAADIAAIDSFGRTPLFFASQELEGAPASGKDRRGNIGELPIFALLSAGADPHVQDVDGETPLHYAAQTKFMTGASALVAHGADPRVPDLKGITPLAIAATLGFAPMIELLTAAADALELKESTPHPASASPKNPARI